MSLLLWWSWQLYQTASETASESEPSLSAGTSRSDSGAETESVSPVASVTDSAAETEAVRSSTAITETLNEAEVASADTSAADAGTERETVSGTFAQADSSLETEATNSLATTSETISEAEVVSADTSATDVGTETEQVNLTGDASAIDSILEQESEAPTLAHSDTITETEPRQSADISTVESFIESESTGQSVSSADLLDSNETNVDVAAETNDTLNFVESVALIGDLSAADQAAIAEIAPIAAVIIIDAANLSDATSLSADANDTSEFAESVSGNIGQSDQINQVEAPNASISAQDQSAVAELVNNIVGQATDLAVTIEQVHLDAIVNALEKTLFGDGFASVSFKQDDTVHEFEFARSGRFRHPGEPVTLSVGSDDYTSIELAFRGDTLLESLTTGETIIVLYKAR